jgi:hypothetical protein
VTFVNDASAPNGSALRLTTDSTTASKAQYLHSANMPISSVTELSYSTKQNSASFAQGDPSYQLIVCLTGLSSTGCNPGSATDPHPETSFTTFVFEPYENGTVASGWQSWDVDAGQMWSSRTVTDPNNADCAVTAGGGGAPFYSLADLQAKCPNAVVTGFGVNIGSNNPSYDTETDLVSFNGDVYNFQTVAPTPVVTLTNKDDCKNGGWMTSNNPTFKNQGDCVSYFATKGKNGANGTPTPVNHFVYGSVTLDNPVQQLNFAGNTASNTGTFTYTNTSPAFTYTTNLTCVNVSGNTAYMTYQIPSDAAFAANTWVIWKVVDGGSSDTAGFTTAPDMLTTNNLCSTGTASVTNYAITAGDIIVQ